MKFKSLFTTALLISSFAANSTDIIPVSAETIKHAQHLRDTALKSDSAWTLLSSLTTEVGPRHPGTPGEKAGIAWGQKKLKALGFDKVWIEPFEMQGWLRISEKASIIAPSHQKLVITALGGSISTPEGGVKASIVHFNTYKELVEADASLVKDRIVFISNRMDRKRDGGGYGPAVIARSKGADEVGRKGGLALLIRSIGTDSHRVPHTGAMDHVEGSNTVAAAALSNPDADQLVRLMELGHDIKLNVDIQTKDLGTITSYNVIGDLTGREKPNEYVVLGSHLDSWDLGTGAIDDGAGNAITMAAAAHIANSGKRPRRTIRVILFGAEELGLLGAFAYAEAHKDEIDNFAIGAESDFGAGPVWRMRSKVTPEATHVIDTMAQIMGPLGIVRASGKAGGGPDVGRLADLGMPAVDLGQDGTDYFDLHHTADDTLDKVDPKAMQQNLAAWSIFTYIAAEWPGSFK